MASSLDRVFRGRIPLPEVSGLAAARVGGGATLVALGDRHAALAVAEVGGGGEIGQWSVLTSDDLGAGPQAARRFTQLEAVALDGAGRAWVLTEGNSSLAGVDLAARAPIAAVGLDTSTLPELHRSWDAADASRAEGLLLLAGGHVLVAKEKDPAGLVEFGPAGEGPLGVTEGSVLDPGDLFEAPGGDLVALAWWPLRGGVAKDFSDLSDLDRDEHGGVWILSDQSRRMGRLRLPLTPEGDAEVDQAVELPKKVGKPEGLAFLPGGLIAVADDRADDKDNLWVFRAARG